MSEIAIAKKSQFFLSTIAIKFHIAPPRREENIVTLWQPVRETDTVESEYLGSERSDKGDREMPSSQKNLTNFKKRSTLIINRNLFTKLCSCPKIAISAITN
jgi:hypothetical protein